MGWTHRGVRLPFEDRSAAGRVLAERLVALGLTDPLVLALPRGGVPVGYEISRRLGAELDVVVARKIGHPHQPELAVGALAEGGGPVFDTELLRRFSVGERDLSAVLHRERDELARRVSLYRHNGPFPAAKGRDVIVVDDGLATGWTARAALRALRTHEPARLVLAVPVGAADTAAALAAETAADDVVVLATPWAFRAVGHWYARFDQLTDTEVLEWLERP